MNFRNWWWVKKDLPVFKGLKKAWTGFEIETDQIFSCLNLTQSEKKPVFLERL